VNNLTRQFAQSWHNDLVEAGESSLRQVSILFVCNISEMLTVSSPKIQQGWQAVNGRSTSQRAAGGSAAMILMSVCDGLTSLARDAFAKSQVRSRTACWCLYSFSAAYEARKFGRFCCEQLRTTSGLKRRQWLKHSHRPKSMRPRHAPKRRSRQLGCLRDVTRAHTARVVVRRQPEDGVL
jgi:hypothetical protein